MRALSRLSFIVLAALFGLIAGLVCYLMPVNPSAAHTGNPFHSPPPVTGVLTPFACTGSSGSTASSVFINKLVRGVRSKFVSARISEADDNTAAAGATIDGIDGFPFNTISFWVSNEALAADVSDRFRIRVFGGDVNGNFIVQTVDGDDNISITDLGNGFSQITLTPNTNVGSLPDIVELTRVYIFVRPGTKFPNLSATIGEIKIDNKKPVPNTTVGTVPCPKDFE